MKAFGVALLSLFFLKALLAQNGFVKLWDARFGGTKNDRLYSFQQTIDGGYILGGYSNSVVSGDRTQPLWGGNDYWVVKIDVAGNKQWEKRFGGIYHDELSSLQQTHDRAYILGGATASPISGDKTDTCRGGADYWIVKISSAGNKIWDKTFGGNGPDQLQSIQQTLDGGYVLAGYSGSDSSGDKTQISQGSWDYWVVKIDSFGTKQWDKRFGGSEADMLYSLDQTSDGGYILGGYSESGISGDKTQFNWGGTNDNDYWIVKIDSLGNKQWDKGFGGNWNDKLYSLQQFTDGGYILGGYSESGISGDKTQANWGGAGDNDYWIVKTDSLGNKQWDQRYGGTNFEGEFGNVSQTTDGGYLMIGSSRSGISGDKSENNLSPIQMWVVKIDSVGSKQWDKTILTTGKDYFANAIQTKEECYAIAGYTAAGIGGYKTQSTWGSDDYWIVKFCDTAQCHLFVNLKADTTVICAMASATMCALSGFTTYHWNNGATTNCITTNLAGNYYVTVTDNSGCTAESNRIAITVLPLPPVGISVNGDTLSVYDAVTQQWYLNGSAINNATSNIYIAAQSGSYTVAVTDTNGCVATSSPVIISGIDNISEEDVVSVYQLTVASWQLTVGNNFLGGMAEVFDANGKLVFQLSILNRQSSITPDVAKGVYLLRISSGKSSVVRKLIRL